MVATMKLLNKRDTAAHLFDLMGLNRLAGWADRRSRIVVLNYHRIGDPESTVLDRELISATADEFACQLDYLAKHFDIVSLDDAMEIASKGRLSERRAICITFDDGYADNATVAAPLLAERGLTATFFLATGFLNNPKLAWWDKLAWIVRNSNVDRVQLPHYDLEFKLCEDGRPHAIQQAISHYKSLPADAAEEMVVRFESACEIDADSDDLASRMWMSWDQARELLNLGMSIGGHTINHPVLAQLDPKSQRDEIFGCMSQIEVETGLAPRHFSYPVGQRESFDDTTKALVQAAGFHSGFSFYGGTWQTGHADRYDIPRVAIERNHEGALFRSRACWPNVFAR